MVSLDTGFWQNILKSLKTWARCDLSGRPLDDVTFEHIHKEFHVLLYFSCIFMDLREGRWIFSLMLITALQFIQWSYMILFIYLGYLLEDDFVEASHNFHMAALYFLSLTVLYNTNYVRRVLATLLKNWAYSFYDYGDNFKMLEMKDTIAKFKRTKTIILMALPIYCGTTGVVCMLGRTMDEYFGVAINETYVGPVYMKTPMPMYYPFVVDSHFKFLMVTISQIMGASAVATTVAGAGSAMIFCNQAIALELKTIIYRLRKIEELAYKLHQKNGGEKLKRGRMFENPGFIECYNVSLQKIANHHALLIESFKLIQRIIMWPAGATVLCSSVIIAMSLFAFVLGGGKPSVSSLVVFLLIGEVLNMAVLCGISEETAELGESLHEELYALNWIEVDTRAKRTMMIMIERSKQPLILMAGLSPLNWETFSTIMETAYSYLNLLIAAR